MRMKRLFLTFVTVCLTVIAYGQTISGSFEGLVQEGRAMFEVDFSQAKLFGMSEEDFAVYEEDWDKDRSAVVENIEENISAKIRGQVRVPSSSETTYKIKIQVLSVSSIGEFVCDAYILNGNQVEASIKNIRSEGAFLRFSTKLRMMKDGARHFGKLAGQLLKEELKNAKRVIQKNEPLYQSA